MAGALNQTEFRELEKIAIAISEISRSLKEGNRAAEVKKTQESQLFSKGIDELKNISNNMKIMADEMKTISKTLASIASDVSELKKKS